MQTWEVLRHIFPEVLADYFEVVKCTEDALGIDFWMDERKFMEKEDYRKGTVRFWGFTEERVIQDFPIRGKAVYLHVRRRRWRDSATGEIFTYGYDDLTADGSKLSQEFVDFLQDADRVYGGEHQGDSQPLLRERQAAGDTVQGALQ